MMIRGKDKKNMTMKWFTSLLSGAALLGVTLTAAVPAAAQAPDGNGPGVARVSVLDGSAVVQRGDSNSQVAAVRNAPLLPGDYISTGKTSRAELQFDGVTAVRLAGNVQARLTKNDPNDRAMQLADGTIEVGLVQTAAPFEVDTPSVTVRMHEAGDYRITIYSDGSTWVTARRGHADVVTPQQTYTLEPGKTMVARGAASAPSIAYRSEVAFDSFDDFNAQRDQTMVAAIGHDSNLSPDIAGYDNLSAYGQWQNVPGYGQSWVPNEPSGWAPYRNGSWTWADGYGWTWVGSEPWGWAPYHYGRWYYANGYGWAWAPPSAYGPTPAWSPALVGFFGFGIGFGGAGWGASVGFGYPSVGWCPLAPYEAYYPWYPGWAWTGYGWGWPGYGYGGYGYGYGGWGSRVVNVTNITNIYRNYRHGGASGTVVGNLQHGTVHGNTVPVTSRNIGTHVGSIHGAVPVTPAHGSLGFGGSKVGAPVTLSKAFSQPRFASHAAVAARTPFAQQQKIVSQAIHGVNADRAGAPVTHAGSFAGHDAQSAPTDSWRRFDQARGNDAQARGNDVGGRSNGQNAVASRQNGASHPSDSWGRFSQQRGVVSASSYGGERGASRSAYGNAYEGSGGSYRGSEQSARGPYQSYDRSYGSVSGHSSYASSPHYSYPSYSRASGSYPSYGRGSYSGAPQSAPRSYGGGGGGYSRGGGGGGSAHGGGGRPPH